MRLDKATVDALVVRVRAVLKDATTWLTGLAVAISVAAPMIAGQLPVEWADDVTTWGLRLGGWIGVAVALIRRCGATLDKGQRGILNSQPPQVIETHTETLVEVPRPLVVEMEAGELYPAEMFREFPSRRKAEMYATAIYMHLLRQSAGPSQVLRNVTTGAQESINSWPSTFDDQLLVLMAADPNSYTHLLDRLRGYPLFTDQGQMTEWDQPTMVAANRWIVRRPPFDPAPATEPVVEEGPCSFRVEKSIPAGPGPWVCTLMSGHAPKPHRLEQEQQEVVDDG